MKWDIEEFPIYKDCLRFIEVAEAEADRVAKRRRDIADHLRRSSSSGLFNLREALNEFAPLEKSRLLRLMQREIGECCAACDAIIRLRIDTSATLEPRNLGQSLIRQAGGLGRAALARLHPEITSASDPDP